ncbi:MAG: rhamnulokinase [Bacteroidales bacterium]|nr:rhamnulokinase [Bacteroidales bacterium]
MIISNHLAIDLGAESGRAVLGNFNGSQIHCEEIHRFPTGILKLSGKSHWNIYRIYEEIKNAIYKAGTMVNGRLDTIGIDTWGVDYALFDNEGNMLGLPYSYRDNRTEHAVLKLGAQLDLRKVYDLTGIQLLPLNTLFQLFAAKQSTPETLAKAADLLFIPDVLNFFLTGIKATEFTMATTSQLFNPAKMDWEWELLQLVGIKPAIMQKVIAPCTPVGFLDKNTGGSGSFSETLVVAPATHDTASAVAAIPASGKDWAFISTGTWALVGVEVKNPVINELTFRYNITNEGGMEGFRLLKNMMGLWLLQRCRKNWGEEDHPYEKLLIIANEAPPFRFFIDPDHYSFFNPDDMPAAIEKYCRNTGQQPPANKAGVVRAIIESLALKTRMILDQIAEATSKNVRKIYLTGGGVHNRLLCQFIANATGLPVISTFAESAAMGNLIGQLIAVGRLKNLEEARALPKKQFESAEYSPQQTEDWYDSYERFKSLINKE